MNRSLQLLTLLAGLGLASAAAASTIIGNPIIRVKLETGASAYVGDVRAYTCPGYVDVAVDQTITTVSEATFELPEDTWCAMDIEVTWAGTGTVDVVPVDGFATLVTDETTPKRVISLSTSRQTATLE